MFVKVRRAFTAGSILFLLVLFTLPSLYLKSRCRELSALGEQVLAYALAENNPAARETYGTMRERYEAMRGKAELFLDHRVMDAATLPLALMEVYLTAGDTVSLEAAFVQFQEALNCILAIEAGDPRLFL